MPARRMACTSCCYRIVKLAGAEGVIFDQVMQEIRPGVEFERAAGPAMEKNLHDEAARRT